MKKDNKEVVAVMKSLVDVWKRDGTFEQKMKEYGIQIVKNPSDKKTKEKA